MDKPKVKIEDWSIMGDRLHGKVYGHPKVGDGKPVVTSSMLDPLLPLNEGDTVETRNTLYELGKEA